MEEARQYSVVSRTFWRNAYLYLLCGAFLFGFAYYALAVFEGRKEPLTLWQAIGSIACGLPLVVLGLWILKTGTVNTNPLVSRRETPWLYWPTLAFAVLSGAIFSALGLWSLV